MNNFQQLLKDITFYGQMHPISLYYNYPRKTATPDQICYRFYIIMKVIAHSPPESWNKLPPIKMRYALYSNYKHKPPVIEPITDKMLKKKYMKRVWEEKQQNYDLHDIVTSQRWKSRSGVTLEEKKRLELSQEAKTLEYEQSIREMRRRWSELDRLCNLNPDDVIYSSELKLLEDQLRSALENLMRMKLT